VTSPAAPRKPRNAVIRVALTQSELKLAQELAERERKSLRELGRDAILLAIARGSTR
jgi:hypothetical protein